jgi:hypothetical protein
MDEGIRRNADSHIDDIIVNNNRISYERVIRLLEEYGREAKMTENIEGGQVVDLRVDKVKNIL